MFLDMKEFVYTQEIQQLILYGSGSTAINFRYENDKGTRFDRSHTFEGIIPNLERRYRGSDSSAVREELSKYISNQRCPSCNGTRLRTEARHVRVGTHTLHEISGLPLGEEIGGQLAGNGTLLTGTAFDNEDAGHLANSIGVAGLRWSADYDQPIR